MENFKETFSEIFTTLKLLYPDLDDIYIQSMVEDSCYYYFNLRNVKENDIDAYSFTKKEMNWIRRCTKEILDRGDTIGAQSYSENGYTVSYFADRISASLKREVFPILQGIED